jgi:hypothetical protein
VRVDSGFVGACCLCTSWSHEWVILDELYVGSAGLWLMCVGSMSSESVTDRDWLCGLACWMSLSVTCGPHAGVCLAVWVCLLDNSGRVNVGSALAFVPDRARDILLR